MSFLGLTLRKYAELGHVHRGEPCQEYPGEWLVYFNTPDEKLELRAASYPDAHFIAGKCMRKYDSDKRDYPIELSICWKCSDNDPRVGEIWFTGFYQHGKFNQFGNYQS